MKTENSTDPFDTYTKLWAGMIEYYDMGLSVFWCRLEEGVVNGRTKQPKSPITNWKNPTRFTKEELAKQMANAKVKIAPAIACGAISGNLEVLDLDEKNWAGISARYFHEVNALYPALFKRLRIHLTMSKGFHIYYKVLEGLPADGRNDKLAARADMPIAKAGIET